VSDKYDLQEAAVLDAAHRKGKPFREFQPRFNLLSAQINETHTCAIEAVKRDPSLDIKGVYDALARAVVRLCALDLDDAAASRERAERLLIEAKRRGQ